MVKDRSTPFLLAHGEVLHLVVEDLPFMRLESGGVSEAILSLMAAYFMTNASYSNEVQAALLFIQYHCLQLKNIKKLVSIGIFNGLIENEKRASAPVDQEESESADDSVTEVDSDDGSSDD